MIYSSEQISENKRHIHLAIAEAVRLININIVLSGAEEGRFNMAYETSSNRLEIWGLGDSVKLEIG